jgi:hypothetical protein
LYAVLRTTGFASLLILARCAEAGCHVVGRDEGVGMVVTERSAAPGKGVLVQRSGLPVLAQLTQIGGEPTRRDESFRVVGAEYPTVAGEDVVLKMASLLMLSQRPQGEAEKAGRTQ